MSKIKIITEQSRDKKKLIKIFFCSVLVLVSILLMVSSIWGINYFGNVSFSEIYYHILAPKTGTGKDIVLKYIEYCIPISIIISAIIVTLLFIFNKNYKVVIKCKKKLEFHSKYKRRRIIFLILLLFISIIFSLKTFKFDEFISNQFATSDFIEKNYVNPNSVKITFPSTKRNLIYIYLESMEYTYEDMNLIPELKEIQNTNTFFNSNHGAYVLGNTGWTIAGTVAQTSGIPLNVSLDNGNNMGTYQTFLPGLTNLGDILYNNGYKNYYTIGSDKEFAGRDKFFTQHGQYSIFDLKKALSLGLMSTSDIVWWGFDDTDLFKYAKEDLTQINSTGENYNYTMLTADTHHPEGYLEENCPTPYDNNYKNVIACSSTQISEFIKWIQKQDWYSNTTIILSGDHTSMNNTIFNNLPNNYNRTTYVTIINPATEFKGSDREYTTMDLFPTTLASMGIKIDGDRLGLGTNLFSDKYTLVEMYGRDYVNSELNKKSDFYNNKFMSDEQRNSESSNNSNESTEE